ncbi:MAG: hypothetical protein HYX47_09965 [Burkholderiales bacterium]|nr:hypothetical protein [Burkholderiales bacterium]
MKAQLRTQVAAIALLFPTALFLAQPAQAATRQVVRSPSPELFSLQVDSDSNLRPGAVLSFTVEGSPRGSASVRIAGSNNTVALKETQRGVYTGEYTVRRADRIDGGSPIRATIRSGGKVVAGNYSFPDSLDNRVARGGPPPVVMPAPVPVPLPAIEIERFVVLPINKVEAGAELRFRLNGMPGATASFDIPGLQTNIPMRELRPGHYEGAYTIRRTDNLTPTGPVVATLRAGPRVVTANLNGPLITDGTAPVIGNLSPRSGETVTGGPTVVSGSFNDAGGTGVDPRSVRILLSGLDVTAEAEVTPRGFTFRRALPPGRHTVDVTARDRVGNVAHSEWTFSVGSVQGAAPLHMPLQIMSHSDNGAVDGNTQLQGRTAPWARVNIRVTAVEPVNAPGRSQVAMPVLDQTVQADAEGRFAVNLAPARPNAMPGTRYDVSVTSSKPDMPSAETRMVLYQRG